MLENEKLIAQLKFNADINISNALKWDPEEIQEMMDTYLKTKSVAQETNNSKLLLVINEKINQLQKVIEIKSLPKKVVHTYKQPEA